MTSPITSRARHVAVIGIGAAGLVAARELRREGHTVVGFEREKQVGGLWVYTDRVEPDSLSVDPDRTIVHSSIYQSLRTNLPRECMGYSDFPFVTRSGDGDPRRYPDHKEVMTYLQDFAKEFEIEEMIRFDTEVLPVEPAPENNRKWREFNLRAQVVSPAKISSTRSSFATVTSLSLVLLTFLSFRDRFMARKTDP